jgi:hypothetical protein
MRTLTEECSMKSFGTQVTTDTDDNAAGLVPRAVDALLGMVALVALVAAFAVEFAPIYPNVEQAAHKLLHVG